jgi:enoyl-CoA hydratase/carnithine racemase
MTQPREQRRPATVTLEHRDRVALVTLSRPDRLNAVTPAMVEELHGVLDELARSTRIRVVVLTGAGRGFCAGMDIRGGDGAAEAAGVEDRTQTLAFLTDDLYEGLAAATEKREPRFRNR